MEVETYKPGYVRFVILLPFGQTDLHRANIYFIKHEASAFLFGSQEVESPSVL